MTTATDVRRVGTRRGIRVEVREAGAGHPVVYLHGVAGLLPEDPFLERLAERYRVHAPVWPGYGEEPGEELLEDMGDFVLHGWDVVDALGLERPPHLVGHSVGGMVAAEMAAACPLGLAKLALVDPFGLWLDEHPIADLFAMLPFEQAAALFADPEAGTALLTGGLDFSDNAALTAFVVANARRLGTAGKILFPIPDRRLSKRLYRVRAETLVVWGGADRLIPPVYAERWSELLPGAAVSVIEGAGHMAPYERPEAVAEAVAGFLG